MRVHRKEKNFFNQLDGDENTSGGKINKTKSKKDRERKKNGNKAIKINQIVK